ncbi:MAG TPA: serpin family protein, partial [Longimicrobiales bacterium]|nr:serpin family protein [Longimicrobiales bacterium]
MAALRRPYHRFRTSATTALTAALALAACGDATGPGKVTPITELPRQLTDAEVRVLGGSNAFAFDLAAELLPGAPGDNLFWSPLSLSMLLGMIMNGTDGDTWRQMRDVLGFDGMSEEDIDDAYLGLIELLTELDPTVETAIGNSTWTDTGFPVIPAFQERVAEHFAAEARELDLQDPASLDAINAWAREATKGRIETIFDELPGSAVMVLLNAIYFKGAWTTEFD